MSIRKSDLQNEILDEWYKWCDAVPKDSLEDYYAAHSDFNTIKKAIERSERKRKYRKKAIFSGQYNAGYIPVNYCVEWI